MNPHIVIRLLLLNLVVLLPLVLRYHSGSAAPSVQTEHQELEDGQEYVVQAGDSLSQISLRFYGRPDGYQIIVDATNARARNDARFAPIDEPRLIRPGQRLWVPHQAELPLL